MLRMVRPAVPDMLRLALVVYAGEVVVVSLESF